MGVRFASKTDPSQYIFLPNGIYLSASSIDANSYYALWFMNSDDPAFRLEPSTDRGEYVYNLASAVYLCILPQ